MKVELSLPKLSPRAAVKQCHFIEATLHEGWCLATQNRLECMLLGNHDHALAVAPDGNYATVHWTSLGKKLSCTQVSTGGVDCFGRFEAVFPPPIRALTDFAGPFRQILPILQDAHRLWASTSRYPFAVSGDLRRDVAMAMTTQKPTEVADLTAVMTAIYDILRSKEAGPQSLEALRQGMTSSFKSVWGRSGDALIALSHHFSEAGEALIACMSHKKSATRLQTVQCIFTSMPPRELTRRILSLGLQDDSKRVREFAAYRIEKFRLREMAPEMEAAISAERDVQTAGKLKQNRSLLKFGVFVESAPAGEEYAVTVRNQDGGMSFSTIRKPRLIRKDVEQIVRDLGGDLSLFKEWSLRDVLSPPIDE